MSAQIQLCFAHSFVLGQDGFELSENNFSTFELICQVRTLFILVAVVAVLRIVFILVVLTFVFAGFVFFYAFYDKEYCDGNEAEGDEYSADVFGRHAFSEYLFHVLNHNYYGDSRSLGEADKGILNG